MGLGTDWPTYVYQDRIRYLERKVDRQAMRIKAARTEIERIRAQHYHDPGCRLCRLLAHIDDALTGKVTA